MIVKSITVRTLTFEMSGTLRNARRRWTAKPILLVFAEGADGTLGIGEGWTSYASQRALAATIEDDVAPLIVGRDASEIANVAEVCRQSCVMSGRYGITAVALSAVEIAVLDLAARTAGEPLYRKLGAEAGKVPVYASGGLYGDGKTAEDLGRELAFYAEQGFTAVKMKVGGAPISDDVRRVETAREAIGRDVALMVDAHYTMAVDQALAFAEAIAPFDVTWLEAPILPTDYRGHAELARRSPVPLCGNETLPWRDPFEALIEAGVTYIMPDVSACGGIGETLAISSVAQAAGRSITLHSSSSIILFLASLHAAAAMPNLHSVEYHMMHRWLFDALPPGSLAVENGYVALGGGPGLSVDLTPDTLDALAPAA